MEFIEIEDNTKLCQIINQYQDNLLIVIVHEAFKRTALSSTISDILKRGQRAASPSLY